MSRGTTFLWDTCAGHAVVRARGRGGDLVSYSASPVLYHGEGAAAEHPYCNVDGIIAYSHRGTGDEIKRILHSVGQPLKR